MKKILALLLLMIFSYAENIVNNVKNINEVPQCEIADNETKVKSCIINIEAEGVGVAPCNGACSMAQAKVMARRAAIVDAYKALAEKIYGIKIVGKDYVKNMILKNSTARTCVRGLIRGAEIVDEEFKDGIYRVRMSVNLNEKFWSRFFSAF